MDNASFEDDTLAVTSEIPAPFEGVTISGSQRSSKGHGYHHRDEGGNSAHNWAKAGKEVTPLSTVLNRPVRSVSAEGGSGYTRKETVIYGQRGKAEVTFINIELIRQDEKETEAGKIQHSERPTHTDERKTTSKYEPNGGTKNLAHTLDKTEPNSDAPREGDRVSLISDSDHHIPVSTAATVVVTDISVRENGQKLELPDSSIFQWETVSQDAVATDKVREGSSDILTNVGFGNAKSSFETNACDAATNVKVHTLVTYRDDTVVSPVSDTGQINRNKVRETEHLNGTPVVTSDIGMVEVEADKQVKSDSVSASNASALESSHIETTPKTSRRLHVTAEIKAVDGQNTHMDTNIRLNPAEISITSQRYNLTKWTQNIGNDLLESDKELKSNLATKQGIIYVKKPETRRMNTSIDLSSAEDHMLQDSKPTEATNHYPSRGQSVPSVSKIPMHQTEGTDVSSNKVHVGKHSGKNLSYNMSEGHKKIEMGMHLKGKDVTEISYGHVSITDQHENLRDHGSNTVMSSRPEPTTDMNASNKQAYVKQENQLPSIDRLYSDGCNNTTDDEAMSMMSGRHDTAIDDRSRNRQKPNINDHRLLQSGERLQSDCDQHLTKYDKTLTDSNILSQRQIAKQSSPVSTDSSQYLQPNNDDHASFNVVIGDGDEDKDQAIDTVTSWVTVDDLSIDAKMYIEHITTDDPLQPFDRHSIADILMNVVTTAVPIVLDPLGSNPFTDDAQDVDKSENKLFPTNDKISKEDHIQLDDDISARQESMENISKDIDVKPRPSSSRKSSQQGTFMNEGNTKSDPDDICIEMVDLDDQIQDDVGGTRQLPYEHFFQEGLLEGWTPSSFYAHHFQGNMSALTEGTHHMPKTKIRQLSLAIGEEWEDMTGTQPVTTSDVDRPISRTQSYRSQRRLRGNQLSWNGSSEPNDQGRRFRYMSHPGRLENNSKRNTVIEKSESRDAIESSRIVDARIPQEHVLEEPPGNETEKRWLLPNPYNRINQRFHSTLHCPCCLFFCFLCCVPAVYFMQLSDKEFDYGSKERSRVYGRRATALYILGTVISIICLSAVTAVVVIFLQEYLMRKQT